MDYARLPPDCSRIISSLRQKDALWNRSKISGIRSLESQLPRKNVERAGWPLRRQSALVCIPRHPAIWKEDPTRRPLVCLGRGVYTMKNYEFIGALTV